MSVVKVTHKNKAQSGELSAAGSIQLIILQTQYKSKKRVKNNFIFNPF